MKTTELSGPATADPRVELLDALRALVAEAEGGAQSAAAGSRLDEAAVSWSRAVPRPEDVVELVAEVRRDGRLSRSREEVLERVTVVAVGCVAKRQVGEALTDPLTGLATRARMADELQHLLAMSQRTGSPLTAVILDVDGLKQVNDERGHAAGDAALAAVGQAIRLHARAADRAFRWGGDEFVVLMPGTSEDDARLVVDRIQQSCPTPTTAGVATHADGTGEVDVATWLSAADADLYRHRSTRRAVPTRTARRFRTPRHSSGVAVLGLAMAAALTGGWVGALTAGHTGGSSRPATSATQALGPGGSGGVTARHPRVAAPASRRAAAAPRTAKDRVVRAAHRTTPVAAVPTMTHTLPSVVRTVLPTNVVPPPTAVVPPPPSPGAVGLVGGLLGTVRNVLIGIV